MIQSNSTTVVNDLAYALEESEVAYWSKFYGIDSPLPCYANIIGGAFVGAIPSVDILAMNRVIGLGLRKSIRTENIRDIISFYDRLKVKRFFVQLSPFLAQSNLQDLLSAEGFKHHNNWVKLLRRADKQTPEVSTHLEIKDITKSDANVYGEIIYRCFDWQGEELIDWLAFSVGQPNYKHYLAFENEKPVAAAALHTFGRYASMAFAGTLPEHRGKGAQQLLLQRRMQDAIQAGCKYFISETAEEKPDKTVQSYRNMRKMGFEKAYLRENWIYDFSYEK